MRLREYVDIQKLGRAVQTTAWRAWPDRWRVDESSGSKPAVTLKGLAAELTTESSPFRRSGDWRALWVLVQVVQRVRRDDDAVLVRLGAPDAPATTMYVDWDTGRVWRVDGLTFIEGAGCMSQRVSFSDYREVGGAMLPWHTKIELAHPLIGTLESGSRRSSSAPRHPRGCSSCASKGRAWRSWLCLRRASLDSGPA